MRSMKCLMARKIFIWVISCHFFRSLCCFNFRARKRLCLHTKNWANWAVIHVEIEQMLNEIIKNSHKTADFKSFTQEYYSMLVTSLSSRRFAMFIRFDRWNELWLFEFSISWVHSIHSYFGSFLAAILFLTSKSHIIRFEWMVRMFANSKRFFFTHWHIILMWFILL